MIGAAIGAVGGYLGSQASAAAQRDANRTNERIADKQMAFQKDMSDTSYQRSVEDLKHAGLNPMLAYSQGGASTPQGASTKVEPEVSPHTFSSAMGAISTIVQAQQAKAQTDNIQADTLNKAKTGLQIDANTAHAVAQTKSEAERPGFIRSQMENLNTQSQQIENLSAHQISALRGQAAQSFSSARHYDSQNVLMKALQDNPTLQNAAPIAAALGIGGTALTTAAIARAAARRTPIGRAGSALFNLGRRAVNFFRK